jgi:isopentenyl-diphosphate delta-isomerase
MERDHHDAVVLVDPLDNERGILDKMTAHSGEGQLHRAISVCLFDASARALLQRRATTKYHFAGRWSNACCTHPRPGEAPSAAAERRVVEELGVPIVRLTHCGSFVYRAADPASGLVEWELDHVFAASLSVRVR